MTYNFDKVFKVVLQRAIQEAGMEAVRADKQVGSHIIHSDMFRELRDCVVVLADLSLGNPNVYYELGIRHVLSASGTVLICREGTELPFDIRLSRIIFYKYNGVDIDWEEVERLVPLLKQTLLTALHRRPDSPVHALLERVFPEDKTESYLAYSQNTANDNTTTEIVTNSMYEKFIAALWTKNNLKIPELIEQHKSNLLGIRSLGEYCLLTTDAGSEVFKIAEYLYLERQYKLSRAVIQNLEEKGYKFTPDNYIKYGSLVAECDYTIEAADKGLKLMHKGLDEALIAVDSDSENNAFLLFHVNNGIGGLYRWRYQLTGLVQDLEKAIEYLQYAKDAVNELISHPKQPCGRIAQLHLRLLVLRRIKDQNEQRPDHENYLKVVAQLNVANAMDATEASYLRWYQIIACADSGDDMNLMGLITKALQADNAVVDKEVGGFQYVMLRRFIANNLGYLRNQTLLGMISQELQYALRSAKAI